MAWWVGCALLSASAASAQTPTGSPRRVEIGVTAVWATRGSLGSANANLTTSGGSNLVVFSTHNTFGPTVGPEVHLGVRLTKRLSAEVSGAWTAGDLRSDISGDLEGAAATSATLRVSLFTVEGSAIWSFARHGKLEPFLRGGGGWMRQLTSDQALSANGSVAGGGAG